MKKLGYILLILVAFLMTGCGSTPVEGNKDKDTDKVKVETIKPEEVKKIVDDYINNPDIDIIDVRSEEEYKEGHINGSINIPSNYLSEIHISDERTLIVYSSTEKRSEMAAEELLKMGYKKVYSMGSILDWDDDLVEDSY